jgi:hypothetical protein
MLLRTAGNAELIFIKYINYLEYMFFVKKQMLDKTKIT